MVRCETCGNEPFVEGKPCPSPQNDRLPATSDRGEVVRFKRIVGLTI